MTGIIIAGGNSTRMGTDKSLLNSNVERLNSELVKFGCNRIITMCGSTERIGLFPGGCVPDSKESLARSLLDIISTIKGEIQLVACDAYLADSELFHRTTGVPCDDRGERQPLLARINGCENLVHSDKISEVFAAIPSCEGGIKARNFNTPEEFKEIQFLQQQLNQ